MGRFQRLEFITARLKSDEPLSIGDIASEVGVSVRTLTRDIQILREQGLPVEADRGRCPSSNASERHRRGLCRLAGEPGSC